jgi:hypothetical protein
MLSGGHNIYADTHPNHIAHAVTHTCSKSKPVKFSNGDQNTIIIEDTDLDVEEEYQTGNDHNDRGEYKFYNGRHSLNNTLFIVNSLQLVFYHDDIYLTIPSYYYHSFYPIYITQRVMRI